MERTSSAASAIPRAELCGSELWEAASEGEVVVRDWAEQTIPRSSWPVELQRRRYGIRDINHQRSGRSRRIILSKARLHG